MRPLTGKVNAAVPMLVILALLVLSALPVVPAFAAVQPQSSQSPTALSKAPVYIHFKPKDATGTQGGSVTVGVVVKNSGTFAFTATSCILWYRLGTSGAWTKAGTCLTSGDFPITFNAGTESKFGATQSISSKFPTGVYEWKIVLIGTYNGLSSESHTGKLTVTIT
jgi:hypothetical protein